MDNIRNNMHWRSGYKAYDTGLERNACNYDPTSLEYGLWQEGWTAAEQDDKWATALDVHPGD